MSEPYILVVDDEPDIRVLVQEILEDEGFEVEVAKGAEEARRCRRARRPDLILLDIWMPDIDGISLLKEWNDNPETPVIMMSGHGTVETAVEATRLGAYDFLEKPLSMAKLLLTVRHALEAAQLKSENTGLKRQSPTLTEPVGHSATMHKLRDQVRRIAQHDASVLIMGESGSGKEVFARYLHQLSSRKSGPFVRVPLSGLTGANSAAELFGAENDADVHFGALELANNGTLFLEDIIDMDLSVQARLLGALQHQSFMRVDGVAAVQINLRVVAATRHDPATSVDSGVLREDLYYHLNVVPLEIPALREHREDIPGLLAFYLDHLAATENLPYRRFTVAAQNRLRNYAWPGNVRELKNLVHRLLILGNDPQIDIDEVESSLGPQPTTPASLGGVPDFELPIKEAREQFERSYLEYQIRQTGGSISKVAAKAGMERTHLYRKLKALGIDPKQVTAASDS